MNTKNLIEWLSILNECWVDTKQILDPLKKANQFIQETKQLNKYMTQEEKIIYFNIL